MCVFGYICEETIHIAITALAACRCVRLPFGYASRFNCCFSYCHYLVQSYRSKMGVHNKNLRIALGFQCVTFLLILLAFLLPYWLITDGKLHHPKFLNLGKWIEVEKVTNRIEKTGWNCFALVNHVLRYIAVERGGVRPCQLIAYICEQRCQLRAVWVESHVSMEIVNQKKKKHEIFVFCKQTCFLCFHVFNSRNRIAHHWRKFNSQSKRMKIIIIVLTSLTLFTMNHLHGSI